MRELYETLIELNASLILDQRRANELGFCLTEPEPLAETFINVQHGSGIMNDLKIGRGTRL
jgi:hypothetical protein